MFEIRLRDMCILPIDDIAHIINLSDEMTERMRVVFTNGYELSVIRNAGGAPRGYGAGAYAGTNTFEIAVFTPENEYTQKFFPENYCDDVMGYMSPPEISTIAMRIACE